MNRKKTLLLIAAMAGLVSCAEKKKPDAKTEQRPNIIFIMTDDQARRTVSAYDNAINHTPNIDRIAEEGAIFTNSFVANSICNPSRASILTGKHSHKNGVVGNASPWDNTQAGFPGLLQNAGYTTALIGKWHLNSPPGETFDFSCRLTGAGKQGFYYNPEFEYGDGKKETLEGHATDLVTDKALDWLSGNTGKEGDDPFVLFVQYKAPHVPRMPEFRFLDRYVNDTFPEPETLFDDYSTRTSSAAGARMGFDYRPLPLLEDHDPSDNIYYSRMTEEQLRKWHGYKDPETREYLEMKEKGLLEGDALRRFEYQKFIKDYLRMIDGVDENVGRLLAWLDEHPEIRDNTLLVYTSDQGFFTGEHGWAEKRFMYEESLRPPLVMRWPGHIAPGSEIDEMVQNIDFAPTFLDVAGVAKPEEIQGRSYLSLLEGNSPAEWRNSIYYHYYDHGLHGVARHDGVRTDRYKLIHFYTGDEWEFYDLEKDPGETDNRYDDEEYKEIVGELRNELERLRETYEVPPAHFQPPYVKSGNDQKL
ncbi:sulfatase family protein [Sinomicrobium soli]|uniref:sulfatase family protein n=1 Tax=Sinomicrobium sp. N-1-3-6 TaxID=2219864 RepID=UPI000DCD2642|nr:sulfatase [Sinomicrobium sp. N-1-3-6]RAV28384.1 sulfatase [Sinomicrobium sp. N-1-3-6]